MTTDLYSPDTHCIQDVLPDVPSPVVVPVYMSTVYDISLSDTTVHYPRSLNTPTQCAVAQKIARLEYADACILFGSGSAALTTVFLSLLKSGDHFIASCDVYSGTRDFIDQELSRWGVSCTWVYSPTLAGFEEARQHNTRAIFIETPGNPFMY